MPDDPHDIERSPDPLPTESPWPVTEIPLARPLEIAQARPRLSDNPMLLTGISRPRVAVHLLVMLSAFSMVMVVITLVIMLRGDIHVLEKEGQVENLGAAFVATMVSGALLAASAVALMRLAGTGADALGLTTRSWGVNLLLAPAVTIASFLTFAVIFLLMQLVWPEGAAQIDENPERIAEMLPDVPLAALCLMMIVVGVYEELLFRGFLLTHLRRLTGSWAIAVALTALPFALMHIGDTPGSQVAATAIPLFLLSVLWSVVTIWRRSLVPSILGHAMFNAIQIVFLKFYILNSPPS